MQNWTAARSANKGLRIGTQLVQGAKHCWNAVGGKGKGHGAHAPQGGRVPTGDAKNAWATFLAVWGGISAGFGRVIGLDAAFLKENRTERKKKEKVGHEREGGENTPRRRPLKTSSINLPRAAGAAINPD